MRPLNRKARRLAKFGKPRKLHNRKDTKGNQEMKIVREEAIGLYR